MESANYFSSGLKALSLCSAAKGARLVQPRTPAEWPMIRTDKGWMTDRERWLRWMTESHTKNEGWNIMLKGGKSKESDHICFYDDPQHTHAVLCSALRTVGQKVAYLEYHQDRLWLVQQVWGGGGTELTWGSGLLIEWWKKDREWEGLTLMDV